MAHTDQPQVEAVLERLFAFDTVSACSNLAIETVCPAFYSSGASNRFSKVPMFRDVAASRM
jgi:hypothetical protein